MIAGLRHDVSVTVDESPQLVVGQARLAAAQRQDVERWSPAQWSHRNNSCLEEDFKMILELIRTETLFAELAYKIY